MAHLDFAGIRTLVQRHFLVPLASEDLPQIILTTPMWKESAANLRHVSQDKGGEQAQFATPRSLEADRLRAETA